MYIKYYHLTIDKTKIPPSRIKMLKDIIKNIYKGLKKIEKAQ